MSNLTDDEIGDYYDRTQAEWLREIPEENQRFHRSKYISDVRANPEAMRQLREALDREDG
jgi:hypothetical protein